MSNTRIDEFDDEVRVWPKWPDCQPTAFWDTYVQLIWIWEVLLYIWDIKAIKRGRNAIQTTLKIAKLKNEWKHNATYHWGKIYKATINRMNTLEFRELSHRGVNLFSRSKSIPSRGYYKIQDIVNQTKMTPYGNILNLCCGSGGWEAFLAPKSMVTKIRSVTLGPGPGHEGHNPFT